MKLAVSLGRFRFVLWFGQVDYAIGVTSRLKDGMHWLMWDFDHVDYVKVHDALREVQTREELPDIYVCETQPKSYIAFCFKRFRLMEAIRIVASTRFVDEVFLTLALRRGYFTLRIGPKTARLIPRPIAILKSNRKSDVPLEEIEDFLLYETVLKRR